jgi:hypothetical protein
MKQLKQALLFPWMALLVAAKKYVLAGLCRSSYFYRDGPSAGVGSDAPALIFLGHRLTFLRKPSPPFAYSRYNAISHSLLRR